MPSWPRSLCQSGGLQLNMSVKQSWGGQRRAAMQCYPFNSAEHCFWGKNLQVLSLLIGFHVSYSTLAL